MADFFPQTVPKKYPRAPGDIPPPHKSAHNDILCTDSKGNQAKQDKPRRAFPCRRSAMLCPWCCFWRPALPEHGAETIAYIKHQAIQTQAQKRKKGVKQESITEKHNNEKAKTSTRREKQKERKQESIKRNKQKQKQSRSGDYIKIPNKQKEKQVITEKQERSPKSI